MATLNLPLPPGSPNWTNLTYTPTWLFTPVSTLPNTVILHNSGRNTVYVGQADVTTTTGLPIPPGVAPVKLTNVLTSLYAVSAVSQTTLIGTITTAGTAGSAGFTTGNGTFATQVATTGSYILVGNPLYTSNTETVVVTGATSGTNVAAGYTTSTLQFYHGVGDVAYLALPTFGQLSVRGGIL